jgi:predicted amidophosphoribosyltransferase
MRWDVITWAPTSDKRRRERGVDQSELIARHLGAIMKCPVRPLLRKLTAQPQTGASRSDRLTQVRFVARVPKQYRSVILVDDVITTGATMHAAVMALRGEAVTNILSLAVASVC